MAQKKKSNDKHNPKSNEENKDNNYGIDLGARFPITEKLMLDVIFLNSFDQIFYNLWKKYLLH